VLWLSRSGPDIIQNAVALCPNCHARMHELDRRDDIQALVKRIRVRDPDLPHFDVFIMA
jgi:5-methylcytosine-specific restriction protein A